MREIVYLDSHSTTPCDPRVVESMLPFFTEAYGNPASSHAVGRKAFEAIETSRSEISSLIGCQEREIIFTSGATEANNIAIQGTAKTWGHARRRIITTPIEHKSVLEVGRNLASVGFELVVLPVDSVGSVDLQAASELVNDQTLLVSIQAANQEIGTIQPVTQIASLAHEHGALVHCDAAQAVGKIPINVNSLSVDFLSFSGHKMYGPKGIGGLFIRAGIRKHFRPIVFGGGQETGLRSGTPNVPGIVGLGSACRICCEQLTSDASHTARLRDLLESLLTRDIPTAMRNGDVNNRLPLNSSITLPGIEAETIMANLPFIAISAGSACSTGAIEPSPVLQAIGMNYELAYSTIRFGLSRFTNEADIYTVAEQIQRVYQRLIHA